MTGTSESDFLSSVESDPDTGHEGGGGAAYLPPRTTRYPLTYYRLLIYRIMYSLLLSYPYYNVVLHNRPYMAEGLEQTDQQVFRDLLQLLQENSSEEVTFLDPQVMARDGSLYTKLFRKPTATNSLLDYRSFHPAHTRNGVPMGQFLRIRRNCTSDEDFRQEALQLTNRFRQRHYPRRCISTAFQRANAHTQESLLVSHNKVLMKICFLLDFLDKPMCFRYIMGL
ncbi:uncharacterized protein LOC143796700 [Ranitomeya variabilis]|uniref:uncharacterized protein LOC143796700 n=1 Tax=Ranitomeya variabilis TaxID=490064 RepID=UPI0040563942